MAIYRSTEWRDYRTDVMCHGIMGASASEPELSDVIADSYGTPENADENTTWVEWCYWNGILFDYDWLLPYVNDVNYYYSLEWMNGIDTYGVDVYYEMRSGYWRTGLPELSDGWSKEKKIGESWWLRDDGTPTNSEPNVWGKWYR